jgi:hypothetical protein
MAYNLIFKNQIIQKKMKRQKSGQFRYQRNSPITHNT